MSDISTEQFTIPQAIAKAIECHKSGKFQDAELIYRRIIEAQPNNVDALHLLGALAHQHNHNEEALPYVQKALNLNPDNSQFLNTLGSIYSALGQYNNAIHNLSRAIELDKLNIGAIYNLANTFKLLKDYPAAINTYRKVLISASRHIAALNNLGIVYQLTGNLKEAKQCFYLALEVDPNSLETILNLGNIAISEGNYNKALKLLKSEIIKYPNNYRLSNNIAIAYQFLEEDDKAIDAHNKTIELNPNFVGAYENLAAVLQKSYRLDEAITSYRRLLEIKPNNNKIRVKLEFLKQRVCLWQQADDFMPADLAHLSICEDEIDSFNYITLPTSALQQYLCAKKQAQHRLYKTEKEYKRAHDTNTNKRLNVAYLSGDFRQHAVAELAIGLFEAHDKASFELFAYSTGPKDYSKLRQRIDKCFDHFVDIKSYSTEEAVRKIEEDRIDILIDLSGYTANSRPDVIAAKAAPLQVNFLGYPGTTGSSVVDYIIADPFIIPKDKQVHFSEHVVYMPDCYQINDRKRVTEENFLSRSECGLPGDGFVFCCFNSNYKITPQLFDIWARVLKTISGSILWLLESNTNAKLNLQREMKSRGIDKERLVFAPLVTPAENLARHKYADLFLDTYPVNAHTTASDALWAGCPLVTCAGDTFISRVAGSILNAVGLPELVTTSLEGYEKLVLNLARNPDKLQKIRQKLKVNSLSYPLFDSERFTRYFEAALLTMWGKYVSGEPAKTFSVKASTEKSLS